jgi:hypothetical protein
MLPPARGFHNLRLRHGLGRFISAITSAFLLVRASSSTLHAVVRLSGLAGAFLCFSPLAARI